MKFIKKEISILRNQAPYFKVVEAECFEVNGHEFAWHKDPSEFDTMEFTHVKSGFGFNGSGTKAKSKIMDSFNMRVNAIGEEKFWKTVNDSKSLDENIKANRDRDEENDGRRKAWMELQKRMNVQVKLCRAGLMGNKIAVDIVSLDDNIKRKYGELYADGVSMKEFVTKTYGTETAQLIEKLM